MWGERASAHQTSNDNIISPTIEILLLGIFLNVESFESHSIGLLNELMLGSRKERCRYVSVVPLSIPSMTTFISTPQHSDHDICHGPNTRTNFYNLHPGVGMRQKIEVCAELLETVGRTELVVALARA